MEKVGNNNKIYYNKERNIYMKNEKTVYYSRLIDKQLEDYLKITGGIYIKGPKWCGKTTSALQICNSYIKLSDPDFEKVF